MKMNSRNASPLPRRRCTGTARDVGTGVCLCRMQVGDYSAVRKMLLIRERQAIEITAWGRSAPTDRLRGRRCASAKAGVRPQAHLSHNSFVAHPTFLRQVPVCPELEAPG